MNVENHTNSNVIRGEKNGKKINLKKSQPVTKQTKNDLRGLQKE